MKTFITHTNKFCKELFNIEKSEKGDKKFHVIKIDQIRTQEANNKNY
jgi:hypothetical protein